jgi:hypothetical protein
VRQNLQRRMRRRKKKKKKKKKKNKSRLEGPCWTLCVFGEQIHQEVPR